MKDLMMLYGVTLGKRYTKKQKAYFIEEINETYPALGFPIKFQDEKYRFFSIRNIIAGNLDKADTVFVAAYDTPSKSFLPNYKYYPFHTEKNLNTEYFNLIAQVIAVIVSALLSYECLRLFFRNNGLSRVPYIVLALFFTVWTVYETKAHPNSFNFNRNSAGLAVMKKIAIECKGNSNVAFIFLDQAVSSFEGLKLLKEQCNFQNKKFIMFDCISSGEKLLVAHRKNTDGSAEELVETAKVNGIELKDKMYSDEKAGKNILAFEENMMYVVSGDIEKNEFVVKDTKSKKDIKVDINRLGNIAKTFIEFAQNK